jgi:hypothetical protein
LQEAPGEMAELTLPVRRVIVHHLIRAVNSRVDSTFLNQLYSHPFHLGDSKAKCKTHFLELDRSEWLEIEDESALLDLIH